MKKQCILIKASLLLCAAAFLTQNTNAQTYPYKVDFEAPENGSAPSKTYANTDTFDLNGIQWVLPGVFLGNMTSNDKFFGDHAARIRRTNNTSGDPGYMMMVSDLTDGIGSLTLNAAMYGSETGGAIGVYYSTDAGLSWTAVPPVINPETVMNDYSFFVNQPGNVRIKIQKEGTGNTRINIDDIEVLPFGSASSLMLIAHTPEGDNIPPGLSNLSLTFSEPVMATNASLNLIKVGGSTVSYPVEDAVITDNLVSFNDVLLENDAQYFVTLPAGAFTNLDGDLLSPEITGNTSWTFTTADTVTPPVIVLTGLDESFEWCDNNGQMGAFFQYSISGEKRWKCSIAGYNDSAAVYINGGLTAGISEINTDFLISSGPIDLSAMNNPELSFRQKRRFNGNVMREVLCAVNYTSGADPTTANWQPVYTFTDKPDTAWELISGIDLSAYRNTPFYLAFTYASESDGAYELSYDDILISEKPSGINSPSATDLNLKVLGEANRSQVLLQIEVPQATTASIIVYDMQGRTVFNDLRDLLAGENNVSINYGNINAGMYVIRINTQTGSVRVKTIVP